MEEYRTLNYRQKVNKVWPKVLPLLFLSVILPTLDVGTDLALITVLFKRVVLCVDPDKVEWLKCSKNEADQYCNTTETVSNNTVCGVSQYYCESNYADQEEYKKCQEQVGPDQYCTSEIVSKHNNTNYSQNHNNTNYNHKRPKRGSHFNSPFLTGPEISRGILNEYFPEHWTSTFVSHGKTSMK